MKLSSDPPSGFSRLPDALTQVKQRPDVYRRIAHDGPSSAAILAECALINSAEEVKIRHVGRWYVVVANHDWLAHLEGRDPFTEFVSFPQLGTNVVYPEVIVSAYSSALATVVGEVVRNVTGEVKSIDAILGGYPVGRAVVFAFDSS